MIATSIGAGLRVAIMTDETGWHTSRLKKAFRARGVDARCIDLAACRIDTTWEPYGLALPGFGHALPDAVFVRGIAGGTFEQVTLRLGILHALRECGVPVYNDARAIERSVDKSMTSFLLHRSGVPTPATWAGESAAFAQRVLMRETAAGHQVVLKPLFGSQGKGLRRLGASVRRDGTLMPLPPLRQYQQVAYLQRFVGDDGARTRPRAGAHRADAAFDWRVLVIGGRAVAAMRRTGGRGWIHNVARGAQCAPAELDDTLAEIAVRATRALGLDYAGVDLMPAPSADPSSEHPCASPLVLEVNGVAAWRGLQSVTQFDIAAALVDDLLDRKLAATGATPVEPTPLRHATV
ncbi:ATP-grasp domain-containing protein [Paraburkholderia sp. SOS3]|jgi:tetrahydromethanopterin:alpha-L-glutamate ligase|uniref:ATP-grasp domain-containing protein n=1 Tax=Paraburkholderia sp. SOS3 TaxID=1926494 RepID=UPI0009473317|nr:RimK family alpha-L-glutamate ligase [Paraburkholderia sp. SOS3]APR38553.1 RimK family alpha-L-glutamate ligase [Paraburkholderia sp. SOS3]